MSWQPTASLSALRDRAQSLAAIRAFFAARGVWEVETPILGQAATTDPQIDSLSLQLDGREHWLQTSPEFHMKRLLAAGSGAIYQLSRVFRAEELGRWHNPEFSLLEWYRPGFTLEALMDEVAELLTALHGPGLMPPQRHSYQAVFEQHIQLDPHQADGAQLRAALCRQRVEPPQGLTRDQLLDLAMAVVIGPALGQTAPCFVYDYPPSQAALARIGPNGLARRFELYWQGVELANGFDELVDATEQARRFAADLAQRRAQGRAEPPVDQRLLAALSAGMPAASGVALGVDRLCALLQGQPQLSKVLAFAGSQA